MMRPMASRTRGGQWQLDTYVREYDVCPRRNICNKHKRATNDSEPPTNTRRDACVSTAFYTCVFVSTAFYTCDFIEDLRGLGAT
jgi:hypothetical protein